MSDLGIYDDLLTKIGRDHVLMTHQSCGLTPHPDYMRYSPEWRFYQASLEGGRPYLIDYLPSHPKERQQDFRERLERAYFPNHVQLTVNVYASHVYKQTIARDPQSEVLAEVYQDMDGKGTQADQFMESVLIKAQTFGVCHVLTNRREAPNGEIPINAAQERELGRKPFYQALTPLDLVDWQCDEWGRWKWVAIAELYQPERPSMIAPRPDPIYQYRVWYEDRWELYRPAMKAINEDGASESKLTLEMVESATHPCGEVPITSFYWGARRGTSPTAQSAIQDVAYANRRLCSIGSLIDEQIYQHVFNILCADEDTWEAAKSTSWSVAGMLKVSKDGVKPYYLGPPMDQVNFLRSEVEKTEGEIRRTTGIGHSGEASRAAHSGEALSYLWHDKGALLRKLAKRMHDGEKSMARHALAWMEAKLSKDWKASYPDRFNVDDLNRDLEQGHQILKLGVRGQALVAIQMDALKRSPALKDASEAQLDAIKQELETLEQANVTALLSAAQQAAQIAQAEPQES